MPQTEFSTLINHAHILLMICHNETVLNKNNNNLHILA